MNVTTIQIKWLETSDYYSAVNSIANSTLNTFEVDNIQVETKPLRYTKERLLEVLNILDCNGKRQTMQQNYKRFLTWRYVYSKFELNTTNLAEVTGHTHGSVLSGLKRIQKRLDKNSEYVTSLRDEVYQVCNEIFI
jgi:hypothetical protein